MLPSGTLPPRSHLTRGSGATGTGPQRLRTKRTSIPASPGKPPTAVRRRQVRDLMTSRVFTLTPNDDLASLYDLMDSRRVRHVPIVDGDGELVGLVTHEDLSRGALGRLEEVPLSVERDVLRRRRIRDIMIAEPDTIEPDADLKDAAEILFDNKIGCLPVVEGLQLVGILTEADFVRDFVEKS